MQGMPREVGRAGNSMNGPTPSRPSSFMPVRFWYFDLIKQAALESSSSHLQSLELHFKSRRWGKGAVMGTSGLAP